MSNKTTLDRDLETKDPLLEALRHLPSHAVDAQLDPAQLRLKREARAAYVRSFEGSSFHRWQGSVMSKVGRAAVPIFLAGVVGLYMSWAIGAATALLH